MGHLLLVESWLGAMSRLLPRAVREAGHRFTFAARDLTHYRRALCADGVPPLLTAEHLLTVETNALAPLQEAIGRWHAALCFDGVLTSCDYYLHPVAQLARDMGLPGPDPDAVARTVRKDHARQALSEAGLPTVGFAVCRDWPGLAAAAQRLGYPLVCKPVDLCAGMYVRRVTDESELRAAYEALRAFPVNARYQPRAPEILLEEVLDGPEVSVETVTVDGATTVVGVTGKQLAGAPFFVETGHEFPAGLPPARTEAAAEAAVAAVAALGFDRGVAHTELRLTAAGPRVVEVNPRPAGNQITELVRLVTGVDLPMVAAQLALGDEPQLAPVDTGVGSAAVAFRLPPAAGTVAAVDSAEPLAALAEVVDWSVAPAGTPLPAPTSNNAYAGHVLVVDGGRGAGARADALASGLTVRLAEPSDNDGGQAVPA